LLCDILQSVGSRYFPQQYVLKNTSKLFA